MRWPPLRQMTRLSGNRRKPAATALVSLRHLSVFPIDMGSHFWLTTTWGEAEKQQYVFAINCSSPNGCLLPRGYSSGHTANKACTVLANLPSRVKWAVDRDGKEAPPVVSPLAWNKYLLNAIHMPAAVTHFISLYSCHSFHTLSVKLEAGWG